ncbi:MAG: ATP-binding protein [Sedimentisphaerales bacterium]|nr:ATP-binding protein [Sedimentisphaerales bacterium]
MSSETIRELTIDSDFQQAKEVEDLIVESAETFGYDEEVLFALRLSLEEGLTNAIRHGNGYDKAKRVRIRFLVSPEKIDVYIEDEGKGFDPEKVPDPTTQANLENPSGRGIMLMRAYMSEVIYNETGNELHLVKYSKAG